MMTSMPEQPLNNELHQFIFQKKIKENLDQYFITYELSYLDVIEMSLIFLLSRS